MFILSVKASKKKLIAIIALALLILGVIIVIFANVGSLNNANSQSGKYSLIADSNESRVSFLSQFGWKINEEPLEVSDITIPEEFNDVYENYNEIQKRQGLDLQKYKGKSCKKYVYEVLNYPGRSKGIRASLIVCKGKVIAGDISSSEMNGFVESFDNSKLSAQTNAKKDTSSSTIREAMERTTERETLAPDPNMPQAPTD